MKKVHKCKLKMWVKVVLVLVIISILGICIYVGLKNFDDAAKQCDIERGYTCSYYDVRQYIINK